MFFYTLLLSCFFHLSTSVAPAPLETTTDISGYWSGITTQNEGGYSSTYDIELHLTEKDGKVTGTSTLGVDDIYAKIELQGVFKNGISLILKDVEIKEAKVKTEVDMEWCMKQYILLLKKENDKWVLEGHWHGETSFSSCTPGKVFLKRGVNRA